MELLDVGMWTESNSLSWMDSSDNNLNSHLVESSSLLLSVSMDGSQGWCKSGMDRFTFLVSTTFGLLPSLSLGTHTKVEEEESLCLEQDLEVICPLSCSKYPTPIFYVLDLNYVSRGSMMPFSFPKRPLLIYPIFFIKSKPFPYRWGEMSIFCICLLIPSMEPRGTPLSLTKCAW